METETIRIDFEVYKALTALRTSAAVSYNDVLRGILDLVVAGQGADAQVAVVAADVAQLTIEPVDIDRPSGSEEGPGEPQG